MFVNVRPRVKTLLETSRAQVEPADYLSMRTLPDHVPAHVALWRYGAMCAEHKVHMGKQYTQEEQCIFRTHLYSDTVPDESFVFQLLPKPIALLRSMGKEINGRNMLWLFREHHRTVPPNGTPTLFCVVEGLYPFGRAVSANVDGTGKVIRVHNLLWGLEVHIGETVIVHDNILVEVTPGH